MDIFSAAVVVVLIVSIASILFSLWVMHRETIVLDEPTTITPAIDVRPDWIYGVERSMAIPGKRPAKRSRHSK